ncbi:MAG TPA: S41 family peptidase [Phycisphaerales bacterium]|nr:S41 family peptidase [Phycisphaerales bacterium]HMP36814.1 S41 family peptidase [Phycisphaerales bacterium]
MQPTFLPLSAGRPTDGRPGRSLLRARLALAVAYAATLGFAPLLASATLPGALPTAPLLVPALQGAATAGRTIAAPASPKGLSVSEWSDRVWTIAKEGDAATLDRFLSDVPDGRASADIERLRESIDAMHRARIRSQDERRAEFEKAMAELREEAAKGNIAKAMTAASLARILSDDWKLELGDPAVSDLLASAEATAKQAEASGDWLLAQELLFRLRQIVERTDRPADEKRYNDALDELNRRIGLLAQYAPRQLWELRRRQAERLRPDDAFPAFNAGGSDDWKDELRGITQPMLMAALRTTAAEHLNNEGWAPLLLGGLDALRILATTEALAETFPGLGDEAKVAAWVATIDELRAGVEAKPPRALGRGDYRELIGALIRRNRETVDLREDVLFKEFGEGATYRLSQLFDDQYTEIIWPQRLRRFEQQTEGHFVGVGILIRQNEKREIIVVNPLEGSPAYRAGLRPEDRIVTVDGEATVGWSLTKAVDNITGPRGKEVRLGVARGEGDDAETLDVPVVRDSIKIRSVNGWWKRSLDSGGNPEWDWMIDPLGRIGYIRLTSFNDDSYADFLDAVRQMRATGRLRGLIVDVRNNPGGLLKSAVEFSSLWIPRGDIVSGQDRNGREKFRYGAVPTRPDASLAGVPTVILINEGSASASEILAGALQAHEAAVIVGERTFGKGSVQTVHDISDAGHGAMVKLTTQHYILPPRAGETSGRRVHRQPGAVDWGVNPDIAVTMTPQQLEASARLRQEADYIATTVGISRLSQDEHEAKRSRNDVRNLLVEGLDPQLQSALIILQSRILKDLEESVIAQRSERS